jgi:hypothetical protein
VGSRPGLEAAYTRTWLHSQIPIDTRSFSTFVTHCSPVVNFQHVNSVTYKQMH